MNNNTNNLIIKFLRANSKQLVDCKNCDYSPISKESPTKYFKAVLK